MHKPSALMRLICTWNPELSEVVEVPESTRWYPPNNLEYQPLHLQMACQEAEIRLHYHDPFNGLMGTGIT